MTPYAALAQWAVGFAFTQAIEVPLYLRVTASWRIAFLASALTHPVIWYVFPLLPMSYWSMALCAEGFAVIIEALWLKSQGVERALLLSLVVNAVSATVGLLLRQAFGVP